MGVLPSLFRGHGLSRPEVSKPIGREEARKILQIQNQQQARQAQAPKTELEIQKLEQDIGRGGLQTERLEQQVKANLPALQALVAKQNLQQGDLRSKRLEQEIAANTPEGIKQAEFNKARGQALAAQVKRADQFKENYQIAEGKLSLTLTAFKDMIKETERLTKGEFTAGRVGGLVTSGLGAAGFNAKVAPFQGQLAETSTAIAKIAAPSAKVGPALIDIFRKTLPTNFSNMAEAKGQILQSISNAYVNYYVTNSQDFPDGPPDMVCLGLRWNCFWIS